ncbi:translocation protein TolB [Candidatus Rubidus massiliensis]|nr:translocation protein TolB [Candidatus Rubidus massiliensis]
MNKTIFFLLICLYANIFAKDDVIYVKLNTESSLVPLYLSEIIDDQAIYSPEYLKKLYEVFRFDLNNNGFTYVISKDKNKKDFFDLDKDMEEIKKLGANFIVKAKVWKNQLSVNVYSPVLHIAKTLENLELKGVLAEDRRKIHQITDQITQTFFQAIGIASSKILYTLKQKNEEGKWKSEIWESDYDGYNAKPIIEQNEGYCITPIYLPPKSHGVTGSICYISYKAGQSKIYFSSKKNPLSQRFTLLKGNQLMPAISRQRDKLAFISDFTGNPDIFIQEFDPEKGAIGKPQQIFSARHATQGTPTFDPTGKKIAFVSNKDGSPKIYSLEIPKPGTKLNQINIKLLTKHNRENSAPNWSPDGKKIAYCAMTQGVRQIWIYDLEKEEEIQLTQGPGNKENPCWAANSLHILFNSTGKNGSELFLLNLNQPNAIKISQGIGEKRFPSWEPKGT